MRRRATRSSHHSTIDQRSAEILHIPVSMTRSEIQLTRLHAGRQNSCSVHVSYPVACAKCCIPWAPENTVVILRSFESRPRHACSGDNMVASYELQGDLRCRKEGSAVLAPRCLRS